MSKIGTTIRRFFPSSNKINCFSTQIPDKLYKNIEIEVKCGQPAILKSYEYFVTSAAKHLGITVGSCWAPKLPVHDRMTLLRSVHIYKKHREQYEVRTYYRYFNFHKLTGSTADTFLEYVQRNLPEGVGMKVTYTELMNMPKVVEDLRLKLEENKKRGAIESS